MSSVPGDLVRECVAVVPPQPFDKLTGLIPVAVIRSVTLESGFEILTLGLCLRMTVIPLKPRATVRFLRK